MAKAPNTIQLKKSSVPGKIPVPGDLVYGELAINYADGVLYYKTASDTIQPIDVGSAEDGVFFVNNQIVTTDYTLISTKNAMSAGPIEIDVGVTVTIEPGARWVVV